MFRLIYKAIFRLQIKSFFYIQLATSVIFVIKCMLALQELSLPAGQTGEVCEPSTRTVPSLYLKHWIWKYLGTV